jgi:hypothetical protein
MLLIYIETKKTCTYEGSLVISHVAKTKPCHQEDTSRFVTESSPLLYIETKRAI